MMTSICFLIMCGFNVYSAIRQWMLIRENRKLKDWVDRLLNEKIDITHLVAKCKLKELVSEENHKE